MTAGDEQLGAGIVEAHDYGFTWRCALSRMRFAAAKAPIGVALQAERRGRPSLGLACVRKVISSNLKA